MAGMKRKHGEDSSEAVYTSKSRSRPSVEGRIDPTYGQRSAIPGLDDDTIIDGDDQDLNYDEEMDALAYLRSVRHEASGIPNLLVAPRTPPASDSREIYEHGDGDFRGYYEDGAYVASSHAIWEDSESAEEEKIDQQQRYYNSIISRHESLRKKLQQMPPLETVEALDQDHPTHVGKLTVAVSRWWKWKMRFVDPLPAQIASMDKHTVLRLLGLISGGTLLKRGAEIEVCVSRWLWSLLARLPERGELTSEEIGVVRDLGKKAVLIGVGLCEKKTWEEGMREVEKDFDEEEHEELPGIVDDKEIELDSEHDAVSFQDTENNAEFLEANIGDDVAFIGPQLVGGTDDDANMDIEKDGPAEVHLKDAGELLWPESPEDPEVLAAARARILARLDQEQSDVSIVEDSEQAKIQQAKDERAHALWNTKATVDMIITIAGEIYGQRDLLEFRGTWDD
ncbi:hypothetical protein NA56DRAFT_694090 [Hyaloscypha hepaticicola]|uniref:Uncharacterized protein n=1 Tax=Hyaloscypha hepaticicola TaxID=2082293 RepID=A0A2J6PKA6_9HELO|nr:hypothetical protein NA56DRAFT_694090 [Hyaloscypha hepaticicola]